MSLKQPSIKPPLHDVKVIDFSELLPGPFLTQMLVDLGAQVVKVERPPGGDPVRFAAPGLFSAVNAGKECIRIDLKTQAGKDEALHFISQADILVESYRPGTLAKLGLGYEELKLMNPGLIYVSLSGYGQSGPDAMLPGHDLNYMAAAGALSLTSGQTETTSTRKTLNSIPSSQAALPYADLNGSMYGFSAVLAALYQRQTTGQGQWLDVSLTEAVLHQMRVRLAVFQQNGIVDVQEQRDSLTRPAYGCFECQDGRFITLGALETHFFSRLVKAFALDRYATENWLNSAHRKQHAQDINACLAQHFLKMPAQQAVDILRDNDVPVMLVLTPSELSEHPQHLARNVFEPFEYGTLPRFPIRLSGMSNTISPS